MNPGMIKHYKNAYPTGTRVRLLSMEDEPDMPKDLEGTVWAVDDIGGIHAEWNNGCSISLIPGVDRFQKIGPVQDESTPLDLSL